MKKIYRSNSNKKFAGVCGGIADYFGIDAVLVRLLFVFLAFTTSGILAYFICMIVIPEEPVANSDDFNNVQPPFGNGPKQQ